MLKLPRKYNIFKDYSDYILFTKVACKEVGKIYLSIAEACLM